MSLFFSIVGAIIVAAFSVAFAAAVVSFAASRIRELVHKIGAASWTNSRKTLGRQMVSESYWFSEYPDAQKLLKIMGMNLMKFENYEINQLRNEYERTQNE